MTQPKTFDFKQKFKEGEQGEKALDRYFRKRYTVTPAMLEEQHQGIDRWFHSHYTGNSFSVEYKTDSVAARSGNVFIETRHSDRAGWAYTSKADWLFYYIPDEFTVYVVHFDFIRRRRLPEWESRYPTGKAQNNGYITYGLIVPLDVFKRCASKTFDLREELP